MGVSSSSNDSTRSTMLISTSEQEMAACLYSKDACSTKDQEQRTYVGTSYKDEDQPRSQLTCATQMTGWQPTDNHNFPMYQQNNEIMELSRIISQLAMANHQLASVYNATLARMEASYLELSKDRQDRKNSTNSSEIRDDFQKRLSDSEEIIEREEAQRLEQRVIRLEKLLAENSVEQSKQRDSRQDNKLQSRIERLENLLKTRDIKDQSRSVELHCESSEQQTNNIVFDVVNKIPGDNQRKNAREEMVDVRYCNAYSDDFEIIVPTINKNSDSANIDKMRRRRARLKDDEQNSTTRNLTSEEILRLSEEVERLKIDRMEYQSTNERLLCNLADQKTVIEKLNVDYEELKMRYVTVEDNLHECKQQYDELTKDLDSAKREIEGLLKEIDVFQSKKNTADARISILEEELQKSLLEKEQIKNTENQKTSKLRAQLAEEVSDKKKQIKALENALQEIQRLKETIKTERSNEESITPKEDVDAVDSIDDISESTSNTNRTSANIEDFKKELTLKREARHRAIAVVSSEMERLRKELDAEKEAHSETLSMLTLLRSAHGDLDPETRNFAKSMMKQGEDKRLNESEKALKCAEARRLTSTLKISDELRNDIRCQIEKVDDLRYHLETNAERHRHRIRCLTEVTDKERESLIARERRTNELKNYLAQVLVRLGDRSFLEVRDDTDAECDRQLENINVLKSLYNERLRVLTELKDSAIKELTDVKQKLEYSLKKSENLEEELKKAEEKVDVQDTEITNLESQLGLTKADCRDLQNQMSLINGLFTQMLLGASSADMDLDRLTQLLQENHDLISDIAKEESTEAAALPKLLLDLVEQVEGGKTSQKQVDDENNVGNVSEADRKEDDLQEEDIAHNLPKVWRVLLELLSCHAVTSPSVSVASCSDPNSCYKSVDTPAGPRLVISVSKTYIRLKELILEKKHLEKEMNRMKQLNTHLESKLGEQEKRLSMVSAELAKTWNIVGRMQAQHQQLHTHEEILRYELQEKRKMLQELKQELEYCREKWESARQKNTNTELEWRSLRREFAARKALAARDSFNSAESGFSDERGDDTDEEEEAIEGRIRHGPRRRTRKESLRAPTPDTESEQPTDTELSESKTGSSITLEQRTPTPETEAELDEAEIVRVDSAKSVNIAEASSIGESTQESLNPLDQALTNVIQNLIKINDGESSNASGENLSCSFFGDPCEDVAIESNSNTENNHSLTISKMDFCSKNLQSWRPTSESPCSSPTSHTLKRTATSVDLPSAVDNNELSESSSTVIEYSSKLQDGEIIKLENTPSTAVSHVSTTVNTTSTIPVFSIGPLPTSALSSVSSSIKSVQFSNPLIVGPSNRFFVPMFGAAAAESNNFTDNFAASSSIMSSTQEEEPMEQRSPRPIESITDSDSISIDSSSSLDTVKEFPIADFDFTPSTSTSKEELQESATCSQKELAIVSTKIRTPEEVLATRADRLKRLEEQADWLMKKMNATSKRSTALCTRLEELHEVYGEPPVPPPMPDVLPSYRLPSSLLNLSRQNLESSSASSIENIEEKSSDAAKNDQSSNANTSK
ncbi:putative protein tag-278 isoform X2 [Camponotus floridanus]|uniref:putative protein tag-278 isoform X2 n=1 Tax=Camponotus floridanus TaxID=104421 RepID=UPI000DC6A1F9|nr:putative protein tag-278 isoform X2 [Camponotus floridanus]